MKLRIILTICFLLWWAVCSYGLSWFSPSTNWLEKIAIGLAVSVLLPFVIFVIGIWINLIATMLEDR